MSALVMENSVERMDRFEAAPRSRAPMPLRAMDMLTAAAEDVISLASRRAVSPETGDAVSVLRRACRIPDSERRRLRDAATSAEMVGLLESYLGVVPLSLTSLSEAQPLPSLDPAIHFDTAAHRVVMLVPVGADDLDCFACWVRTGLGEARHAGAAGVLAVTFEVPGDGDGRLRPSWCAAFYPEGVAHGVPVRALLASSQDDDWQRLARHDLKSFGLPA